MNASQLSDALTTRTIFTRGESVTTTMGVENSMDVRDAFVKGVYGCLFCDVACAFIIYTYIFIMYKPIFITSSAKKPMKRFKFR